MHILTQFLPQTTWTHFLGYQDSCNRNTSKHVFVFYWYKLVSTVWLSLCLPLRNTGVIFPPKKKKTHSESLGREWVSLLQMLEPCDDKWQITLESPPHTRTARSEGSQIYAAPQGFWSHHLLMQSGTQDNSHLQKPTSKFTRVSYMRKATVNLKSWWKKSVFPLERTEYLQWSYWVMKTHLSNSLFLTRNKWHISLHPNKA